MYEMIDERPDWCVSRQRFWGVPIIVFYCDACSKRLEDFTALRNVVKWFEKEGADAWYKHSAEELLPAGTKCSCGATKWRKENDILDVWFDSGSSHLAVLNGPEWPADVYLEGPDQYRGWFQSSLLVATGVRNAAPFQRRSHARLDARRKRPADVEVPRQHLRARRDLRKWGADLLRLWVASQEYQADVKMSERVMTQLSEAYRKIRNTFRFALGNLADFDPVARRAAQRSARRNRSLDARAHRRPLKKCREWYAGYDFHRVYHAIHDFCVVDLSSFYFDVLKDRLYTKAAAQHFAPLRANRGLENHQRAGALARPDPGLHRRGNLENVAEVASENAAPAFTRPNSREPILWPAASPKNRRAVDSLAQVRSAVS